ncbi:MAG: hypothetical protein ACRBHB_18015 [Arenicella sp.]
MSNQVRINSIIDELDKSVKSDSFLNAVDELGREVERQRISNPELITSALLQGYVMNLIMSRAVSTPEDR